MCLYVTGFDKKSNIVEELEASPELLKQELAVKATVTGVGAGAVLGNRSGE